MAIRDLTQTFLKDFRLKTSDFNAIQVVMPANICVKITEM